MARGPSLSMQKRMLFVLAFVFAAGFTVLIGRLVKLQVIDSRFYAQRAAQQQLGTVTVAANRGTIYDRNMKPLAQSATVWDVIVSPSYIKSDTVRGGIADNLSKILNMDRSAILEKLSKNTSYEVIAKKIEKPVADLVRNYLTANNINGVALVEDSKRYYPFGNFASQVLGFTGTDNQGLSGIEKEYDSLLKGVPGRLVTARNAEGTDMSYEYQDSVPAQNGGNVVLTIDEVVQHYLENNLTMALHDDKVANRATGIVMNVNTGEILAMATVPGYDPNSPFEIADSTAAQVLAGKTGDELKQATSAAQQTQWRNKAITEPYEPGSVFKIVTAAAGLDEGVVHESDTFFDPGSVVVSGTTFHCWKSGGHGSQTFIQGFENSCNVVFIEIGRRLGPLNFFSYFSNFGLLQKTGIDLPGEANSIAFTKSGQYGPVQLASASFGQSNKITPIQLITAIAAAANGGKLVQPHIVKEETDSSGSVVKTFGTVVKRQVISAETSKEIGKLMGLEVIDGTGKNAYVAGYRVGGKTGTSQKLDTADPNDRIASFAGIAPSDDPQIAILIILDDPQVSNKYGGVIAAPVAGSVLSETLPYLGVQPRYTEDELTKLDVRTPNLVGQTVTAATNQVRSAGLDIQVMPGGQTVTAQVPAAGDPIPKSGRVIVYTGGTAVQDSVTVPNVVGMTPSQVNTALAKAQLNLKLAGIGLSDSAEKAYEQDIAPETKVAPGTVVTVKFRNEEIAVE